MEKKTEASKIKPAGANEAEELDALIADMRGQTNRSQQLPNKMEASIESKARKRRTREVRASTAWKK
jgi:hypothetical protein